MSDLFWNPYGPQDHTLYPCVLFPMVGPHVELSVPAAHSLQHLGGDNTRSEVPDG